MMSWARTRNPMHPQYGVEHAVLGMAEMGHDMAHDEPYSIRLDPGETKELTWRFTEGGTVEFACHEPGHYEAGMLGEITVG